MEQKISIWGSDSSERRKDASIVTEYINKYIKDIWNDYDQSLNIGLEEAKITIHITDPHSTEKNFYEMEARSQGFKTFISFILTIAAEAENGIVSNFILLLDEPETHLHPSGVRYMKDELLKLSNSGNVIIYATHSIFMIDRSYLRRHIIISKNNELTKLTRVDRSNFIQESVIYEAMGTQIDEFSIGIKNIVLEGELDLKLLSYYIKECLEADHDKGIIEYDLWDGGGTKRIGEFLNTKLLPKKSDWIVVLDNDSPGQQLAKLIDNKLYQVNPHSKIRYIHYSKNHNVELEDILPKQIIQIAFKNTLQQLGEEMEMHAYFEEETKLVSEVINDFKKKKRYTIEVNSIFEETFKRMLDIEISKELDKIPITHNKIEKREVFTQKFANYNIFLTEFLEKFFKRELNESKKKQEEAAA